MTNTTTSTAADQLAANLAKAEAYEAERARLAREYHEADARLSAGNSSPEDLAIISNNGTGCEQFATMIQQLEAERPALERRIKLEEAEAWAQSLLEQMPEGTSARAEAIRQRAAEAITDAIAQAREELKEVARFGADAETQAYRYSRENLLPRNAYHGGSRGSSLTVDGVSYGRVSDSGVGEELGVRVDREHALAKTSRLRAERNAR